MKTKLSIISSLLLVALFAAACGSQSATSTVSHGGPVEDYVSLIDSLRGAGATLEPGDQIEQPFFTVTGQIIQVNGADVQVFEYETAEQLEAEAGQVAPDGGSTGTTMITWMATPHFFKAGRVIVLYVGDDQAILELLKGALGAQFAGR
ncbi:MAG: hypothetical protein H7Y59_11125 [Anaerolineales bacterium]|nr:hypothetical protein [Anaerolineales bacterium]